MKPEKMTLEQLEHVNDIALLGLVKRLKIYADKVGALISMEEKAGREADPDMKDMWVDLTTATNIINHVARSRDDYK